LKKNRVLIYFPTNARAVDQQSVMELLCNMHYEVYLLTWQEPGDLHKNVEKFGVKVFSTGLKKNNGIKGYIDNIRFLTKFIKKHKIDFVFAHLQALGMISGIARWFVSFKLYYFRHNTNAHILDGNFNSKLINNLTNLVVPKIVAVSKSVEEYLIKSEKINRDKIVQINYAFNFQQYLLSDYTGVSKNIRAEFKAEILLICIGRFVPLKRHILMFETIKQLIKKKVDVKLICLGDGELRNEFERYIVANSLTEFIYLLGNKKNVLDYLEAADALLHFSETESLGMVVLESGLVKRPVVVCDSVGVFNDFMVDGVNGYLISKENPANDAVRIISDVNPKKFEKMGELLYVTVHREFDISNVKADYEKLLNIDLN